LIGAVVYGNVTDYSQYREMVGRIKGLLDALEQMDEATKELNAPPSEQKRT